MLIKIQNIYNFIFAFGNLHTLYCPIYYSQYYEKKNKDMTKSLILTSVEMTRVELVSEAPPQCFLHVYLIFSTTLLFK